MRDAESALADLSTDPEVFSPRGGSPLLVIDAASPAAVEVARVARRLPCVCVAVAEDLRWVPAEVATAGFDILLTDERDAPRPWASPPGGLAAGVDVLAAVAAANPFSVVALVQLLRISTGIDVRDAVVAESFAYSALQAGPEFAGWLDRHRRRRSAREARRAAPDRAAGLATTPAVASRAADEPAVLVRRDAGVLTVTLNRPRVHNAVNIDLRDGLVSAFRFAAADPELTAITLVGAGPSFSSGGDLTEFGTLVDPVDAHAVRTSRSIPLTLLASGLPATAYVHGLCIGAGAELPAFCRRVVAAEDATFRLPEITMGLVPGAGGTASIPRRTGPERAAYLILSGQAIDAAQALAWGLVDVIEPRRAWPPAAA
ncbi:enoyl-CoA hydratase/isomerase family protein [Frankia canadensis]|uniref:enoyl-CoA hydratase/isomerase family protein n=1 Tax=Frankia canadensis TaxID=1836972 RepID=UPI001FAEE07B|nr:enoyl-CoA hydratase/isomerase family protein [Frankia canadensis]